MATHCEYLLSYINIKPAKNLRIYKYKFYKGEYKMVKDENGKEVEQFVREPSYRTTITKYNTKSSHEKIITELNTNIELEASTSALIAKINE